MTTNKPKAHKIPDDSNGDFVENLKENAYFQWLVDNRQTLPYVFVAIIVLLAITFKFTSGKASRAESNYIQAENNFAMLTQSLQGEGSEEDIATALNQLTKITASYPDLQSRYDGLIAQVLIAMEKPEEAKDFATRCLKRTARDHLQLFHTFSQITLLIAEGAKGEALIESKTLKTSMLKDPEGLSSLSNGHQSFTAHLFAYNLLRIAMLEKEVGNPKDELEAWKEWKKYADRNHGPVIAEAVSSVDKLIKEGGFTLDQYIAYRNQSIESLKRGKE